MHKQFKPGDIVTVSIPDADSGYGARCWVVVEHKEESDNDTFRTWVRCLSPCGRSVDWSPRYVSHTVSRDSQ